MLVADHASPGEVRGLAMLGATPLPWGAKTDLSARRDLEVLNVLATEDGIADPKKGAVLKYVGGLVENTFKQCRNQT